MQIPQWGSVSNNLGNLYGQIVNTMLSPHIRLIPIGIVVGLITPPLTSWATPILGHSLRNLKAILLRNCPSTLNQKIHAAEQKLIRKRHVITLNNQLAVFGNNFLLSATSLCMLPFATQPLILAASPSSAIPNNKYSIIDLNHIDSMNCGRQEKLTLKAAKLILSCKKVMHFAIYKILIGIGVSYIALRLSSQIDRSRFLERGALSFATFSLIVFLIKMITTKKFLANFETNIGSHHKSPAPEGLSSELVTVESIQRQAELAVKEERELSYIRGFGELALLPREILFMIVQLLPPKQISECAQINVWWKTICFNLPLTHHLQVLRSQFGDELVDRIGAALVTASWLDLQTTLAQQPQECSEAEWQSMINENYLTTFEGSSIVYTIEDRILAHVRGMLNDRDSVSNCEFISRDPTGNLAISYDNVITEAKKTLLPQIARKGVAPTIYNFFINPSDLGNRRIVKFKDAANRYGVAFQYLFSHQEKDKSYRTSGVAILHQLRAGRPEYIWLENQTPYLSLDHFLPLSVDTSVSNLRGLHSSKQRSFLFLYQTNSQCKEQHLRWLKKFVSGQSCGFLFYGAELTGEGCPTLKYQANTISRVDQIRKRLTAC